MMGGSIPGCQRACLATPSHLFKALVADAARRLGALCRGIVVLANVWEHADQLMYEHPRDAKV